MNATCRHLPFLSKGADIRKLACKELVNATCRHVPFLSKGADIRKLACKELANATCRHLSFLSKGADIRKLACKELVVEHLPKKLFLGSCVPPRIRSPKLEEKSPVFFRICIRTG